MTAITAIQYDLFSTARRFSDYETIGGLFKDAAMSSVELTLTERIWNIILEIVREIAECFNIDDEQILDMLVNRSDKLSHFVEIYQLKQASWELAELELCKKPIFDWEKPFRYGNHADKLDCRLNFS